MWLNRLKLFGFDHLSIARTRKGLSEKIRTSRFTCLQLCEILLVLKPPGEFFLSVALIACEKSQIISINRFQKACCYHKINTHCFFGHGLWKKMFKEISYSV